VHELESEVMEQLWSTGEASVRSVMEALNAQTSKDRACTTYMTVIVRLHEKGLLARRRDGKTDYYRPAYERGGVHGLAVGAQRPGFRDRFARLRRVPSRLSAEVLSGAACYVV